MVDSNIKKVVIPKSDLPPIDATNFSYNIRYRLISEDKNRTSHWSRIYNISATPQSLPVSLDYSYIKETVTTSRGTNTAIRLSWIVPTTYQGSVFDIFVKRGVAGTYAYYATSSTNAYTVLRESTETSITILVQMPVYPKVVEASAKLFETLAITVP